MMQNDLFFSAYEIAFEITPKDLGKETFDQYRQSFSGAEPWINCRFTQLNKPDDDFFEALISTFQGIPDEQIKKAQKFFVRLCLTPADSKIRDLLFVEEALNEMESPRISFSLQTDGYKTSFTSPPDGRLYKHFRKTAAGKRLLLDLKSLAEQYAAKGWKHDLYGKNATAFDCYIEGLCPEEACESLHLISNKFSALFGDSWDITLYSHGYLTTTLDLVRRVDCKVADVHTASIIVGIWSLFEKRDFFLNSPFFRNKVFEFPLACVQQGGGYVWFGLRFDHGKTCGVAYRPGVPEAKADSVIESYFPKDLIEKIV